MIWAPSECRGTVILGFEQANKYTVLDQDGATVALMAEDEGSLGKGIGRQLLRTHRAFTATIFSPDGAHPPPLSTPNPEPYMTVAQVGEGPWFCLCPRNGKCGKLRVSLYRYMGSNIIRVSD